ncbi:Crp/Fnr family transcriptional regulator [Glycomyces dulcitolivorans]|uniref:Crp/Fnr family transcriptional regulator n=1 Tax=Glycomyces dulcitolivorans TaxID=2200759 RepID=UPI000DD48F7E|nr:Crp/Fnr family transcriptional regulator [Glycomyces dulcitolivorans]
MNTPPPHLPSRGFQGLLPPDQWDELLRAGVSSPLRGGNLLLSQGFQTGVVYALRSGRVRVVHTEPGGKEALIAVRGPGDLLGEYAYQDHGEHMASVWALEPCEVTALSSARFEDFIRRHRCEELLQRYILGKIRQGGQRIWRAANLQTEQRVALLFLEVIGAARVGADPTIPMTQGQVADSLGVALSSVTLVLGQWRRHGLIRTLPAPLRVLDMAALARHANPR